MTKRVEGDELPLMRDGDRSSREGVRSNCVLEDAEGGRKALLLIFEGGDRDGMGWVESQKIDPNLRYSKESGVG